MLSSARGRLFIVPTRTNSSDECNHVLYTANGGCSNTISNKLYRARGACDEVDNADTIYGHILPCNELNCFLSNKTAN